jgi:hypothetical protein
MMSRFGEYVYESIPVRRRGGLLLLTRAMLLAAVVTIAPAYSDEERRDYFGDYRVPAGFVYSEATITPDKARELARKHVVLTLVNVTEVSPAVAEALVIRGGDTVLTLPALATLNEEAAKILAQRPGRLRLWGLKSVTPEVAAALVSHDGDRLELNGIKEISPAAARALAKGRRSWGISVGLIDLPLEIAAILAEFPYNLDFPYLETLSLESAKAIAEHENIPGREPICMLRLRAAFPPAACSTRRRGRHRADRQGGLRSPGFTQRAQRGRPATRHSPPSRICRR